MPREVDLPDELRAGIPRRQAHLDDVTLTFLPGAKIGVVGPNGAGKSTTLKIMAGLEQPSNGEAHLAPGVSVGILLQEPPLDDSKTVLGNVEQAIAQTKAMLDRFTALTQQLTEDYSDSVLEEMGRRGQDPAVPDPGRPGAARRHGK